MFILCIVLANSAREKERRTVVTVAGGGPAGLAVAAALARVGFRTRVVTKDPEAPWPNSYGCFEEAAVGLDLDEAVIARFANPTISTDTGPRSLNAPYLRFDSERLRTLLLTRALAAGVTVEEGEVDAAPGEESELLIDATGAMSRLWRGERPVPTGVQSAYGLWLQVSPAVASSASVSSTAPEMSLMDYRGTQSEACPSFLYSMRESETRLFVQETVLVQRTPISLELLRTRLFSRLRRMGISTEHILAEERCVIPMGVAIPNRLPRPRVLPFGAAAGLIHPATGYQLTRALHRSGELARDLARADAEGGSAHDLAKTGYARLWNDERRRAFEMYRLGAGILMDLDGRAMQRFVRAFFALEKQTWFRFMEGQLGAPEILDAMWKVFRNAPGGLRLKLLSRGTIRGCRALSHSFIQRSTSP